VADDLNGRHFIKVNLVNTFQFFAKLYQPDCNRSVAVRLSWKLIKLK
jgi:hypothetical protein